MVNGSALRHPTHSMYIVYYGILTYIYHEISQMYYVYIPLYTIHWAFGHWLLFSFNRSFGHNMVPRRIVWSWRPTSPLHFHEGKKDAAITVVILRVCRNGESLHEKNLWGLQQPVFFGFKLYNSCIEEQVQMIYVQLLYLRIICIICWFVLLPLIRYGILCWLVEAKEPQIF